MKFSFEFLNRSTNQQSKEGSVSYMAKRALYTEARELTGGKFSFPEGNILVIAAEFVNRKMRKSDGSWEAESPDCVLRLTGQPLDSNWKKIEDAEPCTEEINVGLMGGIDDFHPGQIDESEIDNPEADVEDLGGDEDASGNTFVQAGDRGLVAAKLIEQRDKKVWSGACYTILMKSLELQGAKPAILNRAYAPDLVGVKGHVKHDLRFKSDKSTSEKTPTSLVFDKVVVFPGQQDEAPKTATKAPAAKAATAAPAKATGGKANGAVAKPVAKVTEPVEAAEEGDNDIMLDAGLVFEQLSAKHAGKSVPLVRMGNEAMIASTKLDPKPSSDVTRKLQALFKNDVWLVENFGVTVEGGAVQF